MAFVSDTDGDERVFNYDLWACAWRTAPSRRLGARPAPNTRPPGRRTGSRSPSWPRGAPLTSSETTMEDEHVWVSRRRRSGRPELGAAVDNRQGEPAWTADGSALLATVQERGDVPSTASRCRRAAERLVPAPGTPGGVGSWSVARDGTMAYALSTREGRPSCTCATPRGSGRADRPQRGGAGRAGRGRGGGARLRQLRRHAWRSSPS